MARSSTRNGNSGRSVTTPAPPDRRSDEPAAGKFRLPELIIYDHIGFKGAYARTNLSFHYLGDFWNDRISSLIVVSGVWRFYRDEYYKGDHWDLGPGLLRKLFH